MSFMDINELSSRDLIAQYVIQCRNKGFCLAYTEYDLIDTWLVAINHDCQTLLLILNDILPTYFEKTHPSRPAKPLRSLHKTVMKRIAEHQLGRGARLSPYS